MTFGNFQNILDKLPVTGFIAYGKKNKLKASLFCLLVMVFVFWSGYLFLKPHTKVFASWFNDNWLYRVPYTVTNSGSADTNKRIKIDIDTAALIAAGKLQETCKDSRFTDHTGKPLTFYLENGNSMATFEADTTGKTSTPANFIYNYTLSHTVSTGTDRFLAVLIHTLNVNSTGVNVAQDSHILNVTYNGVPLSRQTGSIDRISNRNYSSELWTLIAPDTGSNSLVVTFKGDTTDSTPPDRLIADIMDFTGIDQYDPVGGRVSAVEKIGTSNTVVTRTLTTDNDDSIIIAGGLANNGNSTTLSLSTGTTAYQDNTGTASTQEISAGGGYQTAAAAGNHTVSLTGTANSGFMNMVALELKSSRGKQSYIEMTGRNIVGTTAGSSSIGMTHTVAAGTAPLLGVVVSAMRTGTSAQSTDIDVQSVTFDGTALTRSVFVDHSSTNRRYLTEIWTSTAPSVGSKNLVVTFTGADPQNQEVMAYNLTGVSSTTAVGGTGTGTASGTNIVTASVTTTASDSLLLTGGMTRKDNNEYKNIYLNGAMYYQSYTEPIGDTDFNYSSGFVETDDPGTYSAVYQSNTGADFQSSLLAAVIELVPASSTLPTVTNGCNTDTTDYYVLLPDIPAGKSTIYHYYGNPVASAGYRSIQFDESELGSYSVGTGTEAKTPGPVAYWKLDDASGTTANDSTQQGNDGTITNASWATASSCKFGGCLSFDGTGDYVTSVDDLDFDGSGSFTISAWIKTAGVGSTQTIASKYESSGGDGGYILRVNPTGTISFGIDDSNANFADDLVTSTNTYNDSAWHLVTGVKNGSTSIVLYIDGVAAATDSTIGSTGDISNDDALYIGTALDGSSNPFIGYIDEFKFYKYARSAASIQTDNISNTAHGTDAILGAADESDLDSDLVGYWKIDEGYDTNVNDSTDNNNDLTMSASTARWTNTGKFTKAWDGSGPGSNIRMSRTDDDDFDFDGTANFTLSLWFKSDSSANPSGNQYLVDKESGVGYGMYATNTGTVVFGIDDTASWDPADTATSTTDLYDGSWHHIAAVKTSNSKIELFVDGALNAVDSSLASTGTLVNSDTLTFGDQDTSSGNEFAGDLDEIKIYRAALSAAQVRAEYNRGAAVSVGSTGTESDGTTNGNSAARAYCVPGDMTSCAAPVGEWLLNENTGTSTTYDTSGNARNGTLTSITSANWVPGPNSSSALTLDGAADYVDIGTGPSTVNSISFWAYPETTTEYFINLTSTTDYIWLNSGTVTATGLTSPTIYVDGVQTTTMTANKWQHVTVTTGTSENASNFDIGRTQNSNYLQGKVDDVRLYDYARSTAQVAWEYNKGGPLLWYRFDECQGTRAYNSVRNGNNRAIGFDGTINYVSLLNTSAGTCNSGTSTEMWNNGTTGKINASLDFDGTDDYINIPSPSLPTGDFTYATWVNLDTINDERIFMAADGAGNNELSIDVGSVSTGKVTVDVDGGSNEVTSNTAIAAGTWGHIAVTRSGSTIRTYINGVLDSNSGSNGNILDFSTCDLLIGTDADAICTGSLGNYLDGRLDDVRIYTYALTQKQINTVYANGAATFK